MSCIVKCAFRRSESINNNYKRVWLSFKVERHVKLIVKHMYQKDTSMETTILELSTGITEKDFVISTEAKTITLFVTDTASKKSRTIEVPLYLGSEARHIN